MKKAPERRLRRSKSKSRRSRTPSVHRSANQRRELANQLISKALYNEITSNQAEKKAKHAGLPPLASVPTPDEYDPMKESRWTLLQTIAWIAWRDAALVRKHSTDFRRNYNYWVFQPWKEPKGDHFDMKEGWFIVNLQPPSGYFLTSEDLRMRCEGDLPASARFTTAEATKALWTALSEGHLMAEAFDRSGSLVDIPAREWPRLEMFDDRNEPVLRYEAIDASRGFSKDYFRRTDILSIWPPAQYVTIDPYASDLGNIAEQHFGLILSDQAYVPFSVAVCWIASGGGREIVSIKDQGEWQAAAKSLLSHLAAARIEVIGCGDDRESKSLFATAFDSVDCPHPYSRQIAYDLPEHKTFIRSMFYSDEEHWKDSYNDQFFLEGKVRPHWTHLRVRRSQVLEKWPLPPATANLENECYRWLKELTATFKQRPKQKSHLLYEAREKFRGLSKNQSERAWARATNEGPPGWRKRGPVQRV